MKAPTIHWETKRLIADAWSEHQSDGKLSLRDAEDGLGVSASALHAWLTGKQKPQRTKVHKISRYFYPNDAARRKEFASQLERAIEAKPESRARDPLSDLVAGREPLKVGIIPYGQFTTSPTPAAVTAHAGFLDALFRRFAAYAALLSGGTIEQSTSLDKAIPGVCDSGQFHVVLGVLETPDRSQRVKFTTFPVAVPVNAVILAEHAARRADVALALLGQQTSGMLRPDQVVLPIINTKEVGGLHVINFLGFKPTQYIDSKFELDEFKRLLLQRRAAIPTAVMVADELTCAELVVALNKTPYPGDLVFKETTDAVPGLMPRYRLGLFVSREHKAFIEYLAEAFNCFLASNVELTARLYASLCTDLERGFGGLVNVRQWLSLKETQANTNAAGRDPRDRSSVSIGNDSTHEVLAFLLSNPWAKILRRTEEILAPPPNSTAGEGGTRKRKEKK